MPKIKFGKGFFIVTYEDKEIINSIRKQLPKVDLFLCWDSLKENIEKNLPANLPDEHVSEEINEKKRDGDANWLIADDNMEDLENGGEDDSDDDDIIKRQSKREYRIDLRKLLNQTTRDRFNALCLNMRKYWEEVGYQI